MLIRDYLIRINDILKENVEDYEIVIVDDCSTDNTNQIIKELQKDIPQINLIKNEVNLNVGLSQHKAVSNATKDYLFWQTIDWSYDISELRLFFELLHHYDIVAGVRIAPVLKADESAKVFLFLLKLFGIKHITKRSDTVWKAIVSIINFLLIRILFRVPLSDFQNVVFCPTKLFQSIPFESRSSFSNPECLIKAYWQGASIVEVPISFIPRTQGEAKGTRFQAIFNSVKDILRLWFQWIVLGKVERRKNHGNIKRLNLDEWQNSKREKR